MEEVELRPELAVIPSARLLETFEVRVEILLGVEGGAVDPRQLLVVLVPAPVRTCEAGQLQRPDRPGVLQVRPAAEVCELTLGIERDRPFGRADELDLVGLALPLEAGARLGGRYLLPAPFPALGELARDLRLDLREILLADRLRELEVVVEAVLDRRADGDLDPG